MLVAAYLLVAAALGFAFSMGAHYTGACMGMPRAAGAIRTRSALWVMAPLTFVGATLASGAVLSTVGHGILGGPTVSLTAALAIVLSAFALTSAFNFARVPTSTIQILVFGAVGAGLADGIPVRWPTIETLAVLWAVAPVAAFGVGFAVTRAWDRLAPNASSPNRLTLPAVAGLVGVGAVASFAMGANDVSNASGAFVMTGIFGIAAAGAIGGVGLALGVLTWGRPLLERVAFDIVKLDARTAAAAQVGQVVVILGSVAFGYFTSMNQALVGSMLGVGVARHQAGEARIARHAVGGLLVGWGLGPVSGLAVGFLLASGLRLVLPG